jgi:hypothetical protein
MSNLRNANHDSAVTVGARFRYVRPRRGRPTFDKTSSDFRHLIRPAPSATGVAGNIGPKLAEGVCREVRLRELVMGNMSKAKQIETHSVDEGVEYLNGNALSLLYNPAGLVTGTIN